MKRILYSCLALVFCISASICLNSASKDEKISEIFENEKFASFIAQQLGKDVSDNVEQSELDTITQASIVVGSGKVDNLKGIGRLSKLKSFLLSSSSVEEIPKEIGKLNDLQVLDINGGNIKEVPKELNDIASLRIIDLAQNKIEKVPDILSENNKIERVDFSQNSINEYKLRLKIATEVKLDNNQLTSFPNTILEAKNLKKLYLSNNKLNSLPKGLDSLVDLEELDISNNKISIKVPEIALMAGKISNFNLANHNQHVELEDIYLYQDDKIDNYDLIPEILKQVKEVKGTYTNFSSFSLKSPNKPVAQTIKMNDGNELNDDMFDDEGEYTLNVYTDNRSMHLWGYSSFSRKINKINLEKPMVLLKHKEITLYEGDEISNIISKQSTNAIIEVRSDKKGIVSYQNNKVKALKKGEVNLVFNAKDNYTKSKDEVLKIKVLNKSDVVKKEDKKVKANDSMKSVPKSGDNIVSVILVIVGFISALSLYLIKYKED